MLRPGSKLADAVTEIEAKLLEGAGEQAVAQRARWAALVRQLGDDSFAQREAADRELARRRPRRLGLLAPSGLRAGWTPSSGSASAGFWTPRPRRAATIRPQQAAASLAGDPLVWLALLGPAGACHPPGRRRANSSRCWAGRSTSTPPPNRIRKRTSGSSSAGGSSRSSASPVAENVPAPPPSKNARPQHEGLSTSTPSRLGKLFLCVTAVPAFSLTNGSGKSRWQPGSRVVFKARVPAMLRRGLRVHRSDRRRQGLAEA